MNKTIQSLIKELVKIEVSGKKLINGTVIDLGSDMLVLFNGTNYMYIPFEHIHNFEVDQNNEEEIQGPTEDPSIKALGNQQELSFKETLEIAIGKYLEIYVTDNQPLHGQITSVQDDYFVFYSPIYKTMYIPIAHLKWLIPYVQNESLYGLNEKNRIIRSNSELLAKTFKKQIEKFIHRIVVLNIGGVKSHNGKINNLNEQVLEMQKARANTQYLNIDHIKTLHLV
ncbi:hypothetical protein [Psychrobacillus sp. OK032]|uniref:hypothetical protein n=1 Tax=Psychrobacillus sp. OK032 TaxID=1884358 RepID=UPI0008B96839|nr:hypothetical protein [Psychrobacillus sp. OK032]SER62348.1 hypothetical protein SAMN05518872_101388 [Psychrobacillus sp. OK032]